MVGTATIGIVSCSAMAFASPVAEPPPIATIASAPSVRGRRWPGSPRSVGTCWVTSVHVRVRDVSSAAATRACGPRWGGIARHDEDMGSPERRGLAGHPVECTDSEHDPPGRRVRT